MPMGCGEMTACRIATGRKGEELAAQHLTDWGWQVVERNWRCRWGELDIVARDGEWLVAVEVRARRRGGYGTPEESIGYRKKRKLLALAQRYVQLVHWPGAWRIDVVAIELDSAGGLRRLDHYADAVQPG